MLRVKSKRRVICPALRVHLQHWMPHEKVAHHQVEEDNRAQSEETNAEVGYHYIQRVGAELWATQQQQARGDKAERDQQVERLLERIAVEAQRMVHIPSPCHR